MTDESYQEGRKIMQKIKNVRAYIAKADGEVKKWTHIEQHAIYNLKANPGHGKMLEKALQKLYERRKEFADIKFPDSDITGSKKEKVQCEGCGALIAKGNTYCGECLCED